MKERATEIAHIIAHLSLNPHPEGGFYKETFRSKGVIAKDNLPTVYQGDRNFSTNIYFLLTSDNFSAFHQIHQDETWHFYKGDPLEIHMIHQNGDYQKVVLGVDFEKDQMPQFTVEGGLWFASSVQNGGNYALVGCSVAPGFDFDDFKMGERNDLLQQFPQQELIINKLTRS